MKITVADQSRACPVLPFKVSNQPLRPTNFVSICPPFVQILPLLLLSWLYTAECVPLLYMVLCAVGVLTAYGCPRFLPVGSEA